MKTLAVASGLMSLLPAVLACGSDNSCYGPTNTVEHVRHVKRIQPGPPNARYGPKAPLEWGQLNFLHTTDSHGWLEGHLKEQHYGADWSDFATFSRRMKQSARDMDVDLLLADTGDLHDDNGLSDATKVDDIKSMSIFNEIEYDLLTIGIRELYMSEVSYGMFNVWAKLPDYQLPGYWRAQANWPKDKDPEFVDLIFYDFLQKSILTYLGANYTAAMVDCYIDYFLLPYAKLMWLKNIDDCPIKP
ncbi:secreted protein ARB_01864 [Trichoderma asperellum]|uniref:Secreted protein ARB_01864 n=1 Tax=Trichoderma asperellum TaxID=101201 RepID=A0A6V8R5L8_TRIAP|nr:secreted protein ARB_01864 [Trichoderma asperellum]